MSEAPSTLTVRQEDPDQVAMTPTAARAIRRAAVWIVLIAAGVVTAILVVSSVSGGLDGGVPLGADNPAPGGGMAVAEVLRDQGVDVVETATLDDTLDAVATAGDATVLLSDYQGLLDSQMLDRLQSRAGDLVVLDPDFFALDDLAPGLALGGSISGTIDADCDLPAVTKAGTVVASGSSYRVEEGTAGVTSCLGKDGRFGLVQVEQGVRTTTVLGVSGILTNEHVAEEGNAALALNLLGAHRTLVWYIPSAADLAGQVPPNIAELTPPWVTPLAVLVALVALGAMFWRSRRVGPLVVENLPVVVRASETMEGRARLYGRSNARLHALDALRMGAVTRLARTCGLSRLATVTEVVDAVAAATGRDRAAVAGILIDQVPTTDSELVHLSDELLRLEAETTAGTRP
ncbi:MAG: hypothetical protein JWP32_2278 [Schumannella sp.]|nr:hypothetical protein [Schumannella sp.]